VKGAGSLIGAALKDVEGWLWQAELDESVAAAIAYLPPDFEHQRLAGNDVGRLTPALEAYSPAANGDGDAHAGLPVGSPQSASATS
jgi:hypothetical protein